ncbi:MAG TPA: TMEM165/GDT1 family protein [Allosphingosinicella sp.]|nr:TMEM165/GDT1 family protein [Allosphingosinicella sp.]
MDALLTTFLAAALAEIGDKTQLLVIALAARYGRPAPVLAGVAAAALATCVIAALGGTLINGFITLRAISLLVALALVFTGVSGLIRSGQPEIGADWKRDAFVTTAACFFVLELGDKTQFLTAALAAQYDSLVLAAAGATLGVVAANAPGALLGDRLTEIVSLRIVRLTIAILFLIAGFIVAINAWRLV